MPNPLCIPGGWDESGDRNDPKRSEGQRQGGIRGSLPGKNWKWKKSLWYIDIIYLSGAQLRAVTVASRAKEAYHRLPRDDKERHMAQTSTFIPMKHVEYAWIQADPTAKNFVMFINSAIGIPETN